MGTKTTTKSTLTSGVFANWSAKNPLKMLASTTAKTKTGPMIGHIENWPLKNGSTALILPELPSAQTRIPSGRSQTKGTGSAETEITLALLVQPLTAHRLPSLARQRSMQRPRRSQYGSMIDVGPEHANADSSVLDTVSSWISSFVATTPETKAALAAVPSTTLPRMSITADSTLITHARGLSEQPVEWEPPRWRQGASKPVLVSRACQTEPIATMHGWGASTSLMSATSRQIRKLGCESATLPEPAQLPRPTGQAAAQHGSITSWIASRGSTKPAPHLAMLPAPAQLPQPTGQVLALPAPAVLPRPTAQAAARHASSITSWIASRGSTKPAPQHLATLPAPAQLPQPTGQAVARHASLIMPWLASARGTAKPTSESAMLPAPAQLPQPIWSEQEGKHIHGSIPPAEQSNVEA